MEIHALNAAALEEFINSDGFARMPNIPISRHRALSHIHNPRMAADDVLLFIAYIHGEMAGYLGVLPDYYFIDGAPHKFGWVSCLWMNENMRGKGVVQTLIAEAMQKWDGRLIVTEFTPLAKNMYIITGLFSEWLTLHGFRGYIHGSLHEILPKRKPIFQKMKLALNVADGIINVLSFLKSKAGFWNSNDIKIKQIPRYDDESLQFINQLGQKNFTRRGAGAAWLMAWPWVLSSSKGDVDEWQSKYYFSSIDKRFEFQLLKIYNRHKRLIAVALVAIRNNHLKLPYIYFEANDIEIVAKAIYSIIKKEKIGIFTTYNPIIVRYMLAHITPFIFKKKIKREYMAASKLYGQFPENLAVYLQDGDGDCAFT